MNMISDSKKEKHPRGRKPRTKKKDLPPEE